MRIVVVEDPVAIHHHLGVLHGHSWVVGSESERVLQGLQDARGPINSQIHVIDHVLAHCLEGDVVEGGILDLEGQSPAGHPCLDMQFRMSCELQELSGHPGFAGTLETANVSGQQHVSIGVILTILVELKSCFLSHATAVKDGSGGEVEIETVDEVEEVPSVELEGTGLPVAVEGGIKPSIGLQIEDD